MKTPAYTTIPTAFLPADLTIPVRGEFIDIGKAHGYEDMTRLIGCNCQTVERIGSLLGLEEAEMWMDECQSDLPLNLRATMIAGMHVYGDVVITGPMVDSTITSLRMDCPKAFFDRVQKLAEAWVARGLPTQGVGPKVQASPNIERVQTQK
jgi:hypothetical protein